MKTMSIREAQDRLPELAHEVEGGEVVTITVDGRPVIDMVPHNARKGYDPEAGEAYLRSEGTVRTKGFISADFDDPLPEDFLLKPLP